MGRNPFRQYIPAHKHLSHGLIQLNHEEGGWEKLDVPADISRLKLNGKKPAPLLQSLRIHENVVAHGHAKLSANQKHQFEFSNFEGGMPTNEGAKQATSAPRVLTEVNYY